MKEKKNIDQIFRDRFKNAEVSPSPQVWENIQARLAEKKKERKIVPLWWKVAGIAALLALLITIGNSVFNTSLENPSYSTEENIPAIKNNDDVNVISEEKNIPSKIASEEKTTENNSSNEDNYFEINKPKNASDEPSIKKAQNQNKAVATENNIHNNLKTNKKQKKVTANQENSMAVSTDKKNNVNINVENSEKNFPDPNKSDEIINNQKSDATVAVEKNIQPNNKDEVNQEINNDINIEKKSILDAIAENKKENITKKEQLENRWKVSPNVAPVYYSSLGKGSSIDPAFADNSQSGDVNLSYGVQVSYDLNKRWSVRSGVSNVDLSYSTGGIELGTGPVASALRSVDYGGQSVVLTAADKGTFAMQPPGGNGGFGNIVPKSTQGNAEIIQRISYYEVPLELKYSILDTKIGMNVIGGVSTLFLGNNEIAVRDSSFESVLGKANNLTSVSFTTNLGLGVNYKITKKFLFNIEPMFKYQLNPYTDSSVGYKPYYIGLYSGFSLKF